MAEPAEGEASAPKRRRVAEEAEAPVELREWEARANDAITFRLVHSAADLLAPETCPSFKPAFTHQTFPEEIIYGYKGLRVDIFLHALSLHAAVRVAFDARAPATLVRRARQPDDVPRMLASAFPGGLKEDLEAFGRDMATYAEACPLAAAATLSAGESAAAAAAAAAAAGEAGAAGAGPAGPRPEEPPTSSSPEDAVRVLHVPLDSEPARAWSERLQSMAQFFIDGASFIDGWTDPQWEMLLVVQGGRTARARLAGFATVYNFFAWPDRSRLRLSQVVVLPPYQRRRHGARLIRATYALASSRGAKDVTVEEPTPELQRLRMAVEVDNLSSGTPEFVAAVKAAAAAAAAAGPGADDAERARRMTIPPALVDAMQASKHITPPQLRRCWEASLLLFLMSPGAPPDADGALEAGLRHLVMRRLYAQHFAAQQQRDATDKRVRESLGEHGESFVMMRGLPGGAVPATEAGACTFGPAQLSELEELYEEEREGLDRLAQTLSQSFAAGGGKGES